MLTWPQLTWKQAVLYLLLSYYCIYGTHWINLYVFNRQLPAFGYGLVITLLFLSAYPVLAWKTIFLGSNPVI